MPRGWWSSAPILQNEKEDTRFRPIQDGINQLPGRSDMLSSLFPHTGGSRSLGTPGSEVGGSPARCIAHTEGGLSARLCHGLHHHLYILQLRENGLRLILG